jgi:hypothetical protein
MEWISVNKYMPPQLKCDEWLIVRTVGDDRDIFIHMGRFDYELCRWYLKWDPTGYKSLVATHWCYPDDVQDESLTEDDAIEEFEALKKQKKWIKVNANGVYIRRL